MIMEILNPIAVQVDLGAIKQRAHIPEDEAQRLQSLISAVHSVMDAKAVYKVSYIDAKAEDSVIIGGVLFKSKVLRKHLDKVERVFPYVVTIGKGVEDLEKASGDALEKYYLDLIGNAAVVKARDHLKSRLADRYGLEGLSYLGPGQLKDWPLEEQKPLFSLLGDVERAVGVTLSDSLLMIPRKSLSGIYFPTEIPFMACQLCPRESCPSRKARYDEKLAREYTD
ncbi:MAG: vitamin B12 dependent methionine synthase [Desulfobacteraceae bacterium]|nr:MAG: vitamin B12 dependent methionine synthase [Desulfobacteraceae bacterium]